MVNIPEKYKKALRLKIGVKKMEQYESVKDYDSMYFRQYTLNAETDKALHTLEGILRGIAIDQSINISEIQEVVNWYEKYRDLVYAHPFSELIPVIANAISDGILEQSEMADILWLCNNFRTTRVFYDVVTSDIQKLEGVIFCFTGTSSKTTRQGFANIVTSIGARFVNNVTQETNYLVIGNEGNPCWAFSCYGRKVEQAVNLRKSGLGILIIHEHDFWDALEDYTACNTIRE